MPFFRFRDTVCGGCARSPDGLVAEPITIGEVSLHVPVGLEDLDHIAVGSAVSKRSTVDSVKAKVLLGRTRYGTTEMPLKTWAGAYRRVLSTDEIIKHSVSLDSPTVKASGASNESLSDDPHWLHPGIDSDALDTPAVGEEKTKRRMRIKSKLRAFVHLSAMVPSASRVVSRRFTRTPSMLEEFAELNTIDIPPTAPTIVHRLNEVASVARLNEAIRIDNDGGPLATFLRDYVGSKELKATPWVDDACVEGCVSQLARYTVALPNDTPELIRRALSLPAQLRSVTVNCLGYVGSALVLVQRSRSEGVLYSDRLRVQHTHAFTALPDGGVEWRQWTEVVWLKPLPWTLNYIVKVIQQKAVEESRARSQGFADVLIAAAR